MTTFTPEQIEEHRRLWIEALRSGKYKTHQQEKEMSTKKISKAQIKRNRAAWLEALRSGKYKQTKGRLKSRNGAYCCLGVACEVADLPRTYEYGEYYYGVRAITEDNWQDYSSTSLPPTAREWLGVPAEEPELASPVVLVDRYGDEVKVTSLISLNDDHGWSFEQIADAVEKYGLKGDV